MRGRLLHCVILFEIGWRAGAKKVCPEVSRPTSRKNNWAVLVKLSQKQVRFR